PLAIDVSLKDGKKLSGNISISKHLRRDELLKAIQAGTAITGDASEPFAHAIVVFPPKPELPYIAGNQTGTLGGLHYYATVADQTRPTTVSCTYTNHEGRVISGTGTFIDGDVKLFDRHTQKVIAETQLHAKGSPCDAKQTITQGAASANSSF